MLAQQRNPPPSYLPYGMPWLEINSIDFCDFSFLKIKAPSKYKLLKFAQPSRPHSIPLNRQIVKYKVKIFSKDVGKFGNTMRSILLCQRHVRVMENF
jgi:hypothetical protein